MKVGISHTNAELAILDEMAARHHGITFREHLFRSMIKIGRLAEQNGLLDRSAEERWRTTYMVPADTSCQLIQLARLSDIPLSTLITRLLIAPMIREHYEENGLI